MPRLKAKADASGLHPDLMGSRDFRAEKARNGLEYKDFPLSSPTLRKILAGDPNVNFLALIIAGSQIGMRPRIVWEPVEKQ